MSDKKYSEGPWKALINDDGDLLIVPQSDKTHAVFIGNLEDTCGTCHANADLIAAAPELLEALEVLEKLVSAWQTDFEALANDPTYKPEYNAETFKAREIIAKAKGEKHA